MADENSQFRIKRIISGRNREIVLTADELESAYRLRDLQYKLDDVYEAAERMNIDLDEKQADKIAHRLCDNYETPQRYWDTVDETIRICLKSNLYTENHADNNCEEYVGKVLILRPEVLKNEYCDPKYQLFFAESGNGCSPNSRGLSVFGQFLADGEGARFYRDDFVGVIKDECLPNWAKERLAELTSDKSEDCEIDR
jgi:hypothetical protein